ncbi:F-box/kelch-repeat protein At3g23880-like [Neltuma alba]|uniref:F-box/kelch-repeat protein At3g23880-like n=1 Tax=Neltuma alba TaxID=207710 RepID=UPI0010A44392|nr:F-box/kelch-repeat protein At3g23880-like [Prosopis alba]
MEEIFVSLPVKSLLRFKCVAKSWRALIADPSFIARHLERSRSTSKIPRLKLIFQLESFTRVPYISLISKDQPYCVPHHMEPLPRKEYRGFHGHCDGIFCLYVISVTEEDENENKLLNYLYPTKGGDNYLLDKSNLILWNPTTKEDKLIAASQRLLPKGIASVMFGLGFDPITKDYKVVQLLLPLFENKRLVEVYNLSTNSWRVLDVVVPDFGLCYDNCTFYLNGAYHWLVFDDLHGIKREFILSFDFSNEVFGMIQLPPAVDSLRGPGNIFVLDRSLAFVQHSFRTREFKIWVMNEYGVESSWTDKFEIGRFHELRSVLGSWGDNEILIENFDGEVISYNLQNQHMHAPKTNCGLGHDSVVPLMAEAYGFDYVDSLVPLAGRRIYNKI